MQTCTSFDSVSYQMHFTKIVEMLMFTFAHRISFNNIFVNKQIVLNNKENFYFLIKTLQQLIDLTSSKGHDIFYHDFSEINKTFVLNSLC